MSQQRRSLREVLQLGKLERLIMEYFIRQISAGEIIAVLDLKEEVKKRVRTGETDLVSELDDAVIVRELYIRLALLVKNGFLDYNNGTYILAKWIIDVIKEKKGRLAPGIPKNIEELLD